MEPKEMTDEQYIARIGALSMKLEPFKFELKEMVKNGVAVPYGAPYQVFHSPFCGDVDFSAISIEAVQQYALTKIIQAARESGKQSARWEMREALGLNPTN